MPPLEWIQPKTGKSVGASDYLKQIEKNRVVLLGEHHDSAEHHRWQLQVIAGIYTLNPQLVLGFEMFPRQVQPILDQWVMGHLSETELLKKTDWENIWSFDPKLYLPIFHFARMNKIPMVALNVDKAFAKTVRDKGWENIAEEDRQGIKNPAPFVPEYIAFMAEVFKRHDHHQTPEKASDLKNNPAFKKFLQGQQLWDAAMAQGISGILKQENPPLVVAIMGSGHMANRFGVPLQLEALAVKDVVIMVPWHEQFSCDLLNPRFADVVVGVADTYKMDPDKTKPKLGILMDQAKQGILIKKVLEKSIAAQAGLKNNDIIIEMAGRKALKMGEVIEIVQSMVAGAWLPITVIRGTQQKQFVAKFSAAASTH